MKQNAKKKKIICQCSIKKNKIENQLHAWNILLIDVILTVEYTLTPWENRLDIEYDKE